MRMRNVFNHAQPMLARNREYRLHVAGLSIKMHRDDGTGAFSDSCFQQVGVEIVGVRQNINKNGCCANVGDGKASGNIRVWNSNYFISRAYIKCCQRQVQRISAIADANSIARATKCSPCMFKRGQLRAHSVAATR